MAGAAWGSACVSHVNVGPARTERVLAVADFSCDFQRATRNEIQRKACFGATPKPTCETRCYPDAGLLRDRCLYSRFSGKNGRRCTLICRRRLD